MRLGTGLAGLGLAVVVLGWFGRAEYATHMQTVLTNAAQTAVAGSVHDATVTVTGRDITVSGLADGEAEHDALLSALGDVRGRRVVVDELEVLPTVTPFRLTAIWDEGALSVNEGNAPTLTAQQTLAALGAGDLPLAAGAPDAAWGGAAARGLQALLMLEQGQMALVGRELSMSGVARTPDHGAELRGVLDQMPEGYNATMGLSYLDDGSPATYQIHYTSANGAWVEGKLPPGVSPMMLADALGLSALDNSATQGLIGDDQTVPAALSALAPWLSELETLDADITPDGLAVDAGIGAGADPELIGAALREAMGGAATVTVNMVTPEGADGDQRVNASTGRAEVLRRGYWLPLADFEPGADTCPAQADAVLVANRIGFVTGSARLDARAQGAVNALASVLALCLEGTELTAEIGGHTDSTGSPEGNLALSQERAEAVRAALVARGVREAALTAQGYGAAEPIADNDTDEGRAANRRTAVRWVE